MKSILFVLFVVLVIWLAFRLPSFPVAPTIQEPTPTPINLDAEKLFEIIQSWRTSENLQPYVKDERLCEIARTRVTEDEPQDNHAGLYKRYRNLPYLISENTTIALNEQGALNLWLDSPPHAKALREKYQYSCVACKGNYCSQIFSNF